MAKKISLETLKQMLAYARVRETSSTSFIERMTAREEVRKLKARIVRREHDDAMRSMGMKKVRGNLGGIYWE